MYDVKIIVYLAPGSGGQKCVFEKTMRNLIIDPPKVKNQLKLKKR